MVAKVECTLCGSQALAARATVVSGLTIRPAPLPDRLSAQIERARTAYSAHTFAAGQMMRQLKETPNSTCGSAGHRCHVLGTGHRSRRFAYYGSISAISRVCGEV